MPKETYRLQVFIHRKEVISFFSHRSYLHFMIDPEIKSNNRIKVPAELIIFNRGHYSKQARIIEKFFSESFIVEEKFVCFFRHLTGNKYKVLIRIQRLLPES